MPWIYYILSYPPLCILPIVEAKLSLWWRLKLQIFYDSLTYSDHHVSPQAQKFFSLPLEAKLKYKLSNPHVNQGYTADGAEGINDHKECYEHRRFVNDLCPSDADVSEFKSTLDEFYGQCFVLAMNVLKCLAMVMDLGDDFFEAITKRADPQLRLIHYPAIERKVVEQEGHARINAHTDFGLCTLLFQDQIGGLEIDPNHDGNFVPAPPVEGTVLINIADLLVRYMNGRVKSTRHRVVSPSRDRFPGDVLPARFSIPFFVHPDPETLIDPILLRQGEKKLYEPVNAGEWRVWNTSKDYRLKGDGGEEVRLRSVAVAT
jgi:isopenicillin N synthase-like dioxygenase